MPGSFVDKNERLVDAARRVVNVETRILAGFIEQLYTSVDSSSDPMQLDGIHGISGISVTLPKSSASQQMMLKLKFEIH